MGHAAPHPSTHRTTTHLTNTQPIPYPSPSGYFSRQTLWTITTSTRATSSATIPQRTAPVTWEKSTMRRWNRSSRYVRLHCSVLYCDVMHCTVMYCRALHCIVLYCVWHAILSTWKISCLVVRWAERFAVPLSACNYFSSGITAAACYCMPPSLFQSVTWTPTSHNLMSPLFLSLSSFFLFLSPSVAVLQKNKLILVHGTMLSAIDNSTIPITVASLLDHMDWMTDRMINEELTHLIKKMDPVRGKIFWRTFADDVHSAPLNWWGYHCLLS